MTKQNIKFYSNAKKPYNKLSNFHYIKEGINYNGLIYPSIEHAYQASLLNNENDKLDFTIKGKYGKLSGFNLLFKSNECENKKKYWMRKRNIGILAKMAIKKYKNKINERNFNMNKWIELQKIKYNIPKYKDILLSTNDNYLYEFSRRPDYWTAYFNDKNKMIGKNFMGECLMKVRNILKEKK